MSVSGYRTTGDRLIIRHFVSIAVELRTLYLRGSFASLIR